jgi:hypothetical protein
MLQPDAQRKSGRQRYIILYQTVDVPISPLLSYHGYVFSISSHKRALAMERKHASFGIGGGEDGTE